MPNRKIIFLGFITALTLAGLFAFLKLKPQIFQPNPKTWEITLIFNTQAQTLSLKKISTLSETFRPDYRGAADSPYQLLVVDKNGRPLYQTRINITEAIFFSPAQDYYQLTATAAAFPKEKLQETLDTIIFIPYFKGADKIIIEKSGKTILEIKLKEDNKLLTFDFINISFAQNFSGTSGPLQVVFISDGYTTQQQFSSDVTSLKSAFSSTPPYSSSPNMFQFQEVYNTTPLGCIQSFTCINNPQIRTIGLTKNPRASKFIVLVKGTAERGNAGLTNDVGGDTVILNTDLPSFTRDGVHEFLGHGVGQLYDRYVLIGKPGIKNNIRSNCSDNPSGEVFWRQAGAQRAYRGCDSWNLFAPFPLECNPPYLPPALEGGLPPYPPPPGVPPILNYGNRSSIMSGANCAGPQFDSVEQAWIRTQIIPRYQPVAAPTPTPTLVPVIPTTLPQATPIPPTPIPQAVNDCSFNFTQNQIVRGDVLTQVSAVKANSSYYLSLVVLNSAVGSFVGGVTQNNSLVASWNSLKLYPENGPVILRCLITDTELGGNTIFSKEVTVNVQN